ncbi:meiotic recombination protein SPO11-like [Pollicipes pollicipes]|uniref:meiotic recombination protein SPO11-like n=1 Tax=Pollicipes pollicipes TaxID=41117 RepID=UPI00188511AD|nr:meiotic recombination protein SPO11-like [Pollicipes pollicipes]
MRVRKESKLNMMVLLLEKIRHLVATNTHSTKRDIYYQEVALFGSQRAVDALLDDVTRLLAIPRQSSHVRATSKGLVAGDLVLRSGDVVLDCSAARHGLLVPEDLPHVQLVRSSARFILVVEKDATFQKILDSRLLRHLPPGIVITGKGFPDLKPAVDPQRLSYISV